MTDGGHDPTHAVPSEGHAPRGWRGRLRAQQSATQPAWRTPARTLPTEQVARRRWQRATLTTVCFLVAIALFGVLVRSLWFYPRQTPLVVAWAPRYEYPLLPVGWVQEDLEHLLADDTGLQSKTLTIHDLSLATRHREAARSALRLSLQQAREEALHSQVLIVWLNFHAVVADNGRVSLLTPDSVIEDSQTWWPLDDVLQQIRDSNLPADVTKLILLDGVHELSNWRGGVVYNDVVAALERQVAEANLAQLVVLTSTGPGEISWKSRELHGSIFAEFVRLGLAGNADDPEHGGNGDRRVSLQELTRYLQTSIDAWTRSNRAARQWPTLIPADAADVHLAWTLSPTSVRRLVAETATLASPLSSVTSEQFRRLWFDLLELREVRLLRDDPLVNANLEQRLLWLERAADAGDGYTSVATAVQRDLSNTLQQFLSARPTPQLILQEALQTSDAFPGRSAANKYPLHVLSLAERFGTLPVAAADSARAELVQTAATPAVSELAAAIERLSADPATVGLVETQLLRMLNQGAGVAPGLVPGSVSQLLQLSAQWAQKPRPIDERHLPVLMPTLVEFRGRLRNAVDRVLAGQAADVEIRAATEALADLDRLDQQLLQAFQLRDRVRSELPWLAEWICRPTFETGDDEQTMLVNRSLLQLIDAVNVLDQNLNPAGNVQPQSGNEIGLVLGQTDDVRNHYEAIRQLVDATYDRLLKSSSIDIAQVPLAYDLLQYPLLPRKTSSSGLPPAAQRTALIQRVKQATSIADNNSVPIHTLTLIPDVESYARDFNRWTDRWDEHPLSRLLGPVIAADKLPASSNANHEASALRSLEAVARRELVDIPKLLDQLHDQQLANQASPRQSLVDSDRLIRTTAALRTVFPRRQLTRELRAVDLQQLMLVSAQELLDDFWGLADGPYREFFALAAGDHRSFGRRLAEPNPATQLQLQQVDQLRQLRIQGAQQGLQVHANDVLLLEALPTVETTIRLDANAQLPTAAIPPGQGALALQPLNGTTSVARKTIALPPATEGKAEANWPLTLARKDLEGAGLQWDAVVSYRGQQFRGGFLANLPQGAMVDFAPYQYGAATITARGGPYKQESILFILDCSFSMSEPAAAEAPGPAATRLEAASAALNQMLSLLAQRDSVQVGVEFFGHRVGWNTQQPNELVPQLGYGAPIPVGLKPYEDIEAVLPLGRFDASWQKLVSDRLKTVRPWGESPIYLALQRAIEQFARGTPNEARTIVVITDGVNYQFNPSPQANVTLSSILASATQHQTAVHMVGFGMHDKDYPTAQREFGQIAQQTGGSFVSVDRATDLIASLEKILSPQDFSASSPGQPTISAAIGHPLTVPPPFPAPRSVTVALGSARQNVTLGGGEAVELIFDPRGQTAKVPTYDRNLPTFHALTSPAGATQLDLGVHRPIRREDGVVFEFSLQNRERQPVARPALVWLQISSPDARNSADSPYLFYDPNYEPQTTVPVLRWTAAGWPANRQTARVAAWVCEELPAASLQVPLADNLDEAIREGLELTLPIETNARLHVRVRPGDQDRIDVIERRSSDLTADDVLHVRLVSDRTIQRVLRRFDLQQGVAIHMFVLANDARALSDRLRETHLEFRTQSTLKAGALTPAESITIPIAADTGLIPLAPPTP